MNNTGAVVVTGAAQGIGLQIVRTLVEQGRSVIAADIRKSDEIAALADASVRFVECDVSSRADCDRLAGEADALFGGASGLVNNAAIFSTLEMRPFWEIPEDEWNRVMDVNIGGIWRTTTALLPSLKRFPGSSVVNLSSATVHVGRPNYAHYVTSKAAVIGLTRVMSRELGAFGIRANAITPGPIFTGIPRASVSQGQTDALLQAQALHREGAPRDISSVVGFLISEASSFVTGQVLNVDGGMINY